MIKIAFVNQNYTFPQAYKIVFEMLSALLGDQQHMICYTISESGSWSDHAVYATNLLQREYPDRKIEAVHVHPYETCHDIEYREQDIKSFKKYWGIPELPVINRYLVPEEIAKLERQEEFAQVHKWIIENSDCIIAAIQKPSRTTKEDIEYAKQLGKTIFLMERIN